MPRKGYSTEQLVTKLRQAEIELGRGVRTPLVCKKLGGRTDVFPLASRTWRGAPRSGQAAQGT